MPLTSTKLNQSRADFATSAARRAMGAQTESTEKPVQARESLTPQMQTKSSHRRSSLRGQVSSLQLPRPQTTVIEEVQTLRASILPLSSRTGDDKEVDRFFSEVVQVIRDEHHLQNKIFNPSFILVVHVAQTLPPYIKAVSSVGPIRALIPKGSVKDKRVLEQLPLDVPVSKIGRVALANQDVAATFIRDHVPVGEKAIIIDIGGYFAPSVQSLYNDPDLRKRILGIVEDTENGHQRYEKNVGMTCFPILSVARSRLKEGEDYNVGKSIVRATDTILRTDLHTILERHKTVAVTGLGKIGRSIAIHLRQLGVQRVLAYDIDPIVYFQAASLGFDIAKRRDVLAQASLIFCATGKKALVTEDFPFMKDGVLIASCTSADDEFDLQGIPTRDDESTMLVQSRGFLDQTKRIYLLAGGNAVNFAFHGVNGPYIYAVQALLVGAAIGIVNFGGTPHIGGKLQELPRGTEEVIANAWLEAFVR